MGDQIELQTVHGNDKTDSSLETSNVAHEDRPSRQESSHHRVERDYIDQDPVHESDDDSEYSDYIDPMSSRYEDLEEVSCWTKFYMQIVGQLTRFRWSFRNMGHSSQGSGRLLNRDNAFRQCTGKLNINQHAHGRTQAEILALYSDDWFHVVLSWPTWQLMVIMVAIYTVNLLVFAGFYMAVDQPNQFCGLAADYNSSVPFQTAFAFSLITSSTIGYGFPASSDPFFHTCPELVVVVYFQVIVSLAINALIVGMVLQRLGRADSRSHQVVFSDKACIRCVHGKFYFMFQVYDLDRRHPVVEAHVRCYAVVHETDGTNMINFQTRYMRLQNPNDELGSVLFLSVPCTVVHCIDQWSPLMPPQVSRKAWENVDDGFVHGASNRYVFPGLVLREADAECGDRDGTSCPICGESFPTDQHLLRHIRYMQWEEAKNGYEPMVDKLHLRDDDQPISEEGATEAGSLIHGANSEDLQKNLLPDKAREGFQEQRKRNPDTGRFDILSASSSQMEDEDTTVAESSSSAAGGHHQSSSSNKAKMVNASQRSGAAHQDRKDQPNPDDMYKDRAIENPHGSRVDHLLKYYADLSLPLGHRDVDMNLIPTEAVIIPEKEGDRKRQRPSGDVFSLFEDIERTSSKIERTQSQPAPANPNDTLNSVPTPPTPPSPNAASTASAPEADASPKATQSRKFKPKIETVENFREKIREHVKKSGIEIIVLVEGIEARSSNTFQARHSYNFEDIEFDKFFAPCMKVGEYGNATVILNHFHQTIPVPSYVDHFIVQSIP